MLCGLKIDSASDKEKPINVMERVVDLRPDDGRARRELVAAPRLPPSSQKMKRVP